jgi:hypothetical protein
MKLENKNNIVLLFHWSSGVWAITIVTLVIVVGATVHIAIQQIPTTFLWLKYLLMVVFFVTIIAGIWYAPIRLEANDEEIAVRRLFSVVKIPLSEVTHIRQISKTTIDGSIRVFGSGGLFGYLGRFKNDKIGTYNMYATELNSLIMVSTTNNKKYVISCTKPKEFIEYVSSKLTKHRE